MGKSRSKSGSEIEYLRGQIRQLRKELKFYKKREHFFEAPTEEIIEEVEDVDAKQCTACGHGVLIDYDFKYAVLRKCSNCDFEERKKKK